MSDSIVSPSAITSKGSVIRRLDSRTGGSVASAKLVRKVSFELKGTTTALDRTALAGTPSLLRAINERTVLDCVRRQGPISRAQLARETALSKPTVSQALAGLQQAGLVREAGRSRGGKGPTAILYQLNPRAGWVVGIDVGRKWLRAAIADVTGEFVARRDERARVRSASTLIAQIGEIAHGLASDAGIRWGQVTFAAVGSPGVYEPGRGEVALAYSLPGWGRQGLVELVQRELGTKTEFENDVNLAALGERWHGLGKDVQDFVYLHLGTGVGLGIIVNGELYRGSSGAAGEVGYLPLWKTDVRDPEGRRRGPLDIAASAAGVVEAARRAGMTGPLTAERVFTAASRGDRRAVKVVAQEAERIALAIAAVAAILDPELVILGGGIGGNAELLLEPVRLKLGEISPFRPRVEVSVLQHEATLYGSVSMALRSAQDQLFDRGMASA
jgi:predicted NBD/HSP70 family sugar kinase